MAINFDSDLDILFLDFGEDFIFFDNLGAKHTVKAMRAADQEVFEAGFGDLVFEGSAPILRCKSSEISLLQKNNDVVWGGVNYKAVQVMPDPGCSDAKLSFVVLGYDHL